jgi:LytS/YehU family sensor histidine kinase
MILQNSQYALITLENELDSLKLYLELEMLRFDNRFSYSIIVDENVDKSILKVPPLLIQPYVENAIWHGLMPKDGHGRVDIQISSADDFLLVNISDDGIGRTAAASRQQAATHRPLGLQITSQRINMAHDEKHTVLPVNVIDLVDNHGNPAGTEVTLKLSLLYD